MHEFPRYQAEPQTDLQRAESLGCAFGTAVVILVGVVAFLWAMFLLWPA